MESISRKTLEGKIAAISEEIRRYPTPIARCDEQLTALLDERARLLHLLQQGPRPIGACSPEATWANDGGSQP